MCKLLSFTCKVLKIKGERWITSQCEPLSWSSHCGLDRDWPWRHCLQIPKVLVGGGATRVVFDSRCLVTLGGEAGHPACSHVLSLPRHGALNAVAMLHCSLIPTHHPLSSSLCSLLSQSQQYFLTRSAPPHTWGTLLGWLWVSLASPGWFLFSCLSLAAGGGLGLGFRKLVFVAWLNWKHFTIAQKFWKLGISDLIGF